MSTQYIHYPSIDTSSVPTYANLAAFPVSADDGALGIALDSHILYEYNANTLTWVAIAGPGAVLSVGTIDSQTPSANGAVIASNAIVFQSASATVPGLVNNTTQTLSGSKTFTGAISASNLSGTNTGDVTIGTANGLSLAGQVLSLALATSGSPGAVLNIGAANGVATLDGAGKIPVAQLPSAVFIYQGTWDPTTNTPALADGVGTTGFVYWASAAFAGPIVGLNNPSMVNFQIGDLIIYNGSQWESTTPAAGVSSVNGLTGAVVLTRGNLTEATSSVLTITGGTNAVWGSGTSIQLTQSTTSTSGYLSSTDWNTFNGKQASGSYITALTGDATAAGPGSAALTLATVNSNVGSFGGATAVGTFTVNGKGLITAAGSTSIQIAESQVTNLVSDLASKQSTTLANANILVGNVSNVATAVAVTGDISLSNAGVTAYSGTVPLNKGGTGQTTKAAAFDALSPMSASGDIIYGGASGTGTRLAKGSDGQVLTLASGIPSWAAAATGNLGIITKTTTYSITTADQAILGDASGAGFTMTLPTAVGNDGKVFTITKIDSSLTNSVSVTTVSAQTIGYGATTVVLKTQGESYIIYSDGANWQIQSHDYNQAYIAYTPTFGATTSAPSEGTGVTKNFRWRRVGDSIQIIGSYVQTGAGSAGTGTYLIPLPTGLTANTTKMTPDTSTKTACTGLGSFQGSGAEATANVYLYDSSNVALRNKASSGNFAAGATSNFGSTDLAFTINISIPIQDWEG